MIDPDEAAQELAARTPWGVAATGKEPGAGRMRVKLRDVATILDACGVEPISAICGALPELSPEMRVKTLLSLSEFCYPKLGRTVLAGDPEAPIIGRIERIIVRPGEDTKD